eukprot:7245557-Pyramimonas_sp.AAC.1
MHRLFCEAAAADNESCAIALLGLVKCFECVSHWGVWGAGQHWGLPARLLPVILRIYGAAKRVGLQGA